MPDFFASLLIFTVVISIFIGSWNSIISNQTEFSEEETMTDQAVYTTTFLVSTAGYPSDWEDTDGPSIPGFAEEDHVLSVDKMTEFKSLNYVEQSRLLQVQNFYMKVYNESGLIQAGGSDLEYGNDYSSAETVVPLERNVIVNKSGNLVDGKLRFVAWR
jgi:hypothetical protein